MASPPRVVRTADDLNALRDRLAKSQEHARQRIKARLDDPHFLRALKFERVGCDPFDTTDAQNLLEQVNQQATYEVAVDALTILMQRHPSLGWSVAPGAWSAGSDIESEDGLVAAEVFAAVDPSNNDKLVKDIARMMKSTATSRYVIYRSPAAVKSERQENGITIISLGA